jgi:hypothetical protein
VSYDEFLRKSASTGEPKVDASTYRHVSSSSSSEKRTASSRGPQSYYTRTRTEEFLGGTGREREYYKMEEEVDADGPQTGRIRERQREEYGSPPPLGGYETRIGGRGGGVGGRGSDWRERYFSPPASAGIVESGGSPYEDHAQYGYGYYGGRGPRRWSESGQSDYYGT